MKKDEFLDKKCPICGKGFAVLYPNRWAYKRARTSSQFTYFCSWKCLRANEKRKDNGKMKKLTEEQKQEAIQIALKGTSPVTYLEDKCGINNGYQCWKNIRDRLKVNDPETWEKVQKALGETKARKKAAKPVEEDEPKTAGEAFQACLDVADKFFSECEDMGLLKDKVKKPGAAMRFAPDGEHLEKINKPLQYEDFTVRAVEGTFGRYGRDTVNGVDYIDFESKEGDELHMRIDGWRNFISELKEAAKVLGVEW